MSKITLEQIENINTNTVIMTSLIVKFIQQNYYLNDKLMKMCLLDMLKSFSEALCRDNTDESKFCHRKFIVVINKLYPEITKVSY
jgi:membrane-anchored glycerophosphoryl diester phosphodiesterase (GDPDase)